MLLLYHRGIYWLWCCYYIIEVYRGYDVATISYRHLEVMMLVLYLRGTQMLWCCYYIIEACRGYNVNAHILHGLSASDQATFSSPASDEPVYPLPELVDSGGTGIRVTALSLVKRRVNKPFRCSRPNIHGQVTVLLEGRDTYTKVLGYCEIYRRSKKNKNVFSCITAFIKNKTKQNKTAVLIKAGDGVYIYPQLLSFFLNRQWNSFP